MKRVTDLILIIIIDLIRAHANELSETVLIISKVILLINR